MAVNIIYNYVIITNGILIVMIYAKRGTGKSTLKCRTCGKEFVAWAYEIRNGRTFCSGACRRYSAATVNKIRAKKIGVPIHTEERKRELKILMTGNSLALGHTLSKEHRQSIIDAHTGEKSHFFKDGRCLENGYISWQKKQRNHRLRAVSLTSSHTVTQWNELKRINNYRCLMCGKSEPFIGQRTPYLTEDHIIPLSKGGDNNIGNIQPLCLRCNLKKHSKIIPVNIPLVLLSNY